MSQTKVSLPWLDEPVPLAEAVEALGRVSQEDAERVDRLEERLDDQGAADGPRSEVEDEDDLNDQVDTLTETVDETSEERTDVRERVEALQRRIEALEDASSIECPNCGSTDGIFKASIAAAIIAQEGELNDEIAEKLNESSHLCLECDQPFRVQPERS